MKAIMNKYYIMLSKSKLMESYRYNFLYKVKLVLHTYENLRYHFPTCYAYSVKEPIGELNLKRALDEDTGVSRM